jgi:oxygen-independent coproporphyrinogen-3 oxidase
MGIESELIQRKDFLSDPVQTIYFGGGTPSILNESQIESLLITIENEYKLENDLEITIECNPDDLTKEKLSNYFKLGVNRLSIGIQSFNNDFLRFMNRAHDATEARAAITNARKAGFQNLNLDLIYGIPSENHQIWKDDLTTMLDFRPEHLSAYALTIEDKTVFGHWIKTGKLSYPDDSLVITQYNELIEKSSAKGYNQYEVSNFCLPGHRSRHNSSYWQGKAYLGVGPSAHSFKENQRITNISNNPRYLKCLREGLPFQDTEILNPEQLLIERVLTGIRSDTGLDLEKLNRDFSFIPLDQWNALFEEWFRRGLMLKEMNHVRLNSAGYLFADEIASNLVNLLPGN